MAEQLTAQKEAALGATSTASGKFDGVPPVVCASTVDYSTTHAGLQWLAAYEAYARARAGESWPEYHTWGGLWALSALAARRVYTQLHRRVYPALSVMFVAKSSLFAKSVAAGLAADVVLRVGGPALFAPSGTPQALIHSMAGTLPENYGALPARQQEHIRARLAWRGARAWYAEEFGGQLVDIVAKKGTFAAYHSLLREVYDCAPVYQYATIARGEEVVNGPYLALLACLTPADFAQAAATGSGLWTDGFLSRFALCVAPVGDAALAAMPNTTATAGAAMQPPDNVIRPLQRMHNWLGLPSVEVTEPEKGQPQQREVIIAGGGERCIPMSGAALAAFDAYRDNLRTQAYEAEAAGDGDDAGTLTRQPELAARVALLLAAVGGDREITPELYAAAVELCSERQAAAAELRRQCDALSGRYDKRGKETPAADAKIRALLLSRGPLTERELTQYSHVERAVVATTLTEGASSGRYEQRRDGRRVVWVITATEQSGGAFQV